MLKRLSLQDDSRERGMVLVVSALLIVILLALSGALLMFSTTEMKALRERTETYAAFFLAESGIEAAKWEIADTVDPDGDGIGNKTLNTQDGGVYTVTAIDLGFGNFQLTSQGTMGQRNVTLQVTVGRDFTNAFPQSALSIVGDISNFSVSIEMDSNLILDGGDSPALTISDSTVIDSLGADFVSAIESGSMLASNLTGNPTTTFTDSLGNPVELPIMNQVSYADSLKDLTTLYTNIVNMVNTSLIPAATVMDPVTTSATYGSAGSPVTVYSPGVRLIETQTVTGYGTLIIGDDFKVMSGATVNWTGDVFVIGDTTNDAKILIEGGNLNVTGNLVILGEAQVDTKLLVKSGGVAQITGNLFLGSDWSSNKAKSVLLIDSGGKIHVDGLLTMEGPDVKLQVDPLLAVASQANELFVNGAMQIAVPNVSAGGNKLDVNLRGNVQLLKNDDQIQNALDELNRLGVDYSITEIDQLMSYDAMTTYSWERLSN